MTELSSYIASLEDMSIPELKKIWEQYFKLAPEQNTKSFLVRRIAYTQLKSEKLCRALLSKSLSMKIK